MLKQCLYKKIHTFNVDEIDTRSKNGIKNGDSFEQANFGSARQNKFQQLTNFKFILNYFEIYFHL